MYLTSCLKVANGDKWFVGGNDGINNGSGRVSNKAVAFGATAVVVFMLGLSFAAVPLYRIFCQVTGFGGTTQRAEAGSDEILARKITVRFDSNVAKELPWKFAPVERTIDIKIGETALIYYRATNLSDKPVIGTASFNVTPEVAGSYFSKIECFCFTEQRLAPGQSVKMPVRFFVDPEITRDVSTMDIKEITLSYTFFAKKGVSEGVSAVKKGSEGQGEKS